MKSIYYLLLLVFLFVISCTRQSNLLIVEKTTCNFTENPLGIESQSPVFGWQLQSGKQNQSQSAYQIVVSDNEKDISACTGNIWNTEKVTSWKSLLVPYQGPKLQPAKKYYWRVKVWNQDGVASRWSHKAWFVTGLFTESDWQGARWIGYTDLPAGGRVVPGVHYGGNEMGDKALQRPVIPVFRKEFELDDQFEEATLFISGLGQYEASMNGNKVGNGFLTPGWTHYDKTVFYNTYDVTGLLRKGKNVIGAMVGNGFYNINRERYRKLSVVYGEPKLIVLLRVRLRNGAEKIIVSGKGWKTSTSPIIFTSIYGGEDYDARMEQPGWDKPGFNDGSWREADSVTSPLGWLTAETDYPVAIQDSFAVKSITKLADGSYLYDFGQNASGIVELKVKGEKGKEVRLIPAELITADLQPNQSASGTPYYFSYILKGEGVETWKPRFTYYGFRYVKVEGAVPDTSRTENGNTRMVALVLMHNRNATPVRGSFSCSNELFNRTFDLINWAIKSNLQSVLTDCPHREKLGWLEQTYLMGGSVHFNFDLYHLYNKQVNDMMEAQTPEGLVPDIAPEFVFFESGFRDSPEWGSAAVILPWLVYKWYGDTSTMAKAWPMMVRYVAYLEGKSEDHILNYGLGDWFDLGPDQPGPAQLTPKALTATAIYYYDLRLLTEMAGILKKEKDRKHIAVWADEVKKAFNKRFFNPETGVIATGSQTSMSMPWSVGLVDSAYQSKVMQNLEDSIRAHGKALTAGDIGFHFLVEGLMNGGKSQLLYEMNARNDVPGYGYQLKKGATALTESWPALENVSNNHLMLGHLMEWFYAGLGGIRQSGPSAAYREIVIKPEILGDLTWVKAGYESPFGPINSSWERKGNELSLDIDIPVNTTALVYFPGSSASGISEGGSAISGKSIYKFMGQKEGCVVFRIGSGKHHFKILLP
jgi:alpha-L-rhamnosidase